MCICVFSVWPLPNVKDRFRKQKKECPYFQSEFFFKSFGQYLNKSKKKWFPIVFSKSDLTGVGSFFWRDVFLKKPANPLPYTKLSKVRTEWTGSSDHKIILVRKFSRDFKRTERYTQKQAFKNCNQEEFRTALTTMPEMAACLVSTSADLSTSILQQGITRVLDTMAPVRTIQTRISYVPYLTNDTKQLQAAVKDA